MAPKKGMPAPLRGTRITLPHRASSSTGDRRQPFGAARRSDAIGERGALLDLPDMREVDDHLVAHGLDQNRTV